MAFVQIMSYSTTSIAEVEAATAQWKLDTEGVGRARRRLVLKDREVQDRFVEVVFFDSYEDAMHNSGLPATAVLASALEALTINGCEFQNLDVFADET